MLMFLSLCKQFLLNNLMEVVLYILVDVVTKSSLKEARDDTREKRQIWLYESIVLLLVAVIVYYFHHSPYLLGILSASTLIYTQLLGRVNFRFWWLHFKNRWDEFQQHEESMEQYHKKQTAVPTIQAQPVPTQPAPIPMSSSHSYDASTSEPWYPSDNTSIVGQSVPAFMNNMPPNMTPPSYLRHNNNPGSPKYQAPQPIYSSSPINVLSRNPLHRELTRRALHPSIPSPIRAPRPLNQSVHVALKDKVMSVFGIVPEEPRPPGLPNKGQNLCFLNSVLQCIARTPRLSICLNRDINTLKCSADEAAFAISAAETLSYLNQPIDSNTMKVFDHFQFRNTSSNLRGSVLIAPSQTDQSQQDAAEFLQWFLQVMHNALNSYAHSPGYPSHEVQIRYQNRTLELLLFVYGKLTEEKLIEAKEACKDEIKAASSLDSNSYAEPIQRLSDLEWLSYKEKNNSIFEDRFTGQVVDAQMCIVCNSISVNIQNFNILPVPLVAARHINGLIYLEDCFMKFCNEVDLYGADGIKCDYCNNITTKKSQVVTGSNNNNFNVHSNSSPAVANGDIGRAGLRNRIAALQADSVLTSSPTTNSTHIPLPNAAMSPIPLTGQAINDSGFQDHQMRTSTPIHAAPKKHIISDARRRSLLRQLPECLIVQLMRFSQKSGDLRKSRKPVNIPLTGLDLSHLIIDRVMHREDIAGQSTYRYNLYGMCVHIGSDSMSSGHYISYVKINTGQWFKFDDESSKLVNMEYELTTKLVRENAYILFYRSCEYQ